MNHKPSFAMKTVAVLSFNLTLAGLLPGASAQKIPNPYVTMTNVDSHTIIARINGIVIVSALKEFNPDGVPLLAGLTVKNLPLLSDQKFQQLIDPYLSRPMNDEQMRRLQREIVLYYRTHDRPLVDVLYPEQDVSNGMLQIIVLEGRLKALKVQDAKGNPYTNGFTSPQFILGSIRLRTNDVISERTVVENLDWLNRNPFRQVEAVYEPDRREYGLTSLLLRVDERMPVGADLGYEDTGSRVTGEDRIVAGVTWGKAFGLTDHQFRYQFTGNPGFDLLRVHAVSYLCPLPWHHAIRVSGYYLDVKGDLGSGTLLQGSAYQASV